MSAPQSVQIPVNQAELEPSDHAVARRAMSYQEYLRWNPEGGLIEWVNREAIQYISATAERQRVVNFLVALLQAFCELFHLGQVFTGPYTMRAQPEGSAREPDVFVVLSDQLTRVKSDHLEGPADVVIEVVSDDSVGRDRVTKFDEYEAAGVGEYWILDPRPGRQRASFFVLDSRQRFQPIPLDAGDVYRSTMLPGFWLTVDWLWQADSSVMQALAEVVGSDRLFALIRAGTRS